MDTRIYWVIGPDYEILVEAPSKSAALRHVAGNRYHVRPAKPKEVAALLKKGTPYQVAGAEPEPAEEEQQ